MMTREEIAAEAIGMSLSGVEKAVRNMKASGEIERKDGNASDCMVCQNRHSVKIPESRR